MSDDNEATAEQDPLVTTTSNDLEQPLLEQGEEKALSLWEDTKDTLWLAGPIFLSMASWVGMKTTDSALLGHVSADALAAAALSDLWTMSSGVLIRGQVLGILMGSAIGAGNMKLAGIYLQVSYWVLAPLVVLVMIAWCFTEPIWLAMGAEPHIASMAGLYAKVLALSLPSQMFYGQLTQFFSSQRIMDPLVNASVAGLAANLVLGLILVLGVFIPNWEGWGFPACPTVTTGVEYVQLFVLWFVYCYIKKLHVTCWDGWSYQEITWDRIKTFCNLYFPAALGMASDFWRVAFVGLIAATLGTVEVAVFNTSYRIMWVTLTAINAVSTASGIKMTIELGKLDFQSAKQAAAVSIGISAVLLLVVGFGVYWKARWFGLIFTNDTDFLDLFEEASLPFALTLVLMNFSIALERIPISMGRTTEVFWYGLIASWGAQVPAVFCYTQYWRDDLTGLYWGMVTGYGVLVVLYGSIVLRSDWKYYAELARQRSEVSEE